LALVEVAALLMATMALPVAIPYSAPSLQLVVVMAQKMVL
jgi:hypothetical protein